MLVYQLDTTPIDQRHLLTREFVQVVPGLAEPDLMEPAPVLRDDAALVVGRLLCGARDEADGGAQREPAEADVGHPRLAVEIDLQEQVRPRRRDVAWLLVAHPRGEGAHGEADGLEHVEQQSVLLEAVAAAVTAHQFVDERLMRQFDGPAEQDVEILERDRVDVTSRDGLQDLQRRRRGTAVADAGEVPVEPCGLRRHLCRYVAATVRSTFHVVSASAFARHGTRQFVSAAKALDGRPR